MKSPFDYGAVKCRKQSRSRSPERKRYKRSWSLYKFRKLPRENNLHEVLVRGNGYCFLSCIIITLAEHGINKTLEILSTEVMTHIIENKDDFIPVLKMFLNQKMKKRT